MIINLQLKLQPNCPKCGAEGVPIIYGYALPSLVLACKNKKALAGGCCYDPRHAAGWYCYSCNHSWGKYNDPLIAEYMNTIK
jgi:hypothetical protein